MFKKEYLVYKVYTAVGKIVYITPIPSSISYLWNFGSLLGICLGVQITSGLFLSFHYVPTLSGAFDSVVDICEEVTNGWIIRSMHANGASFFFICIYGHIGRGLYYSSYTHTATWELGVLLLFMLMATAFLGYVLPWGQMSLWGATVITNLLSAIPYLGGFLVEWIWGGFSVSQPTLERFFSIHFLLPFMIFSLAFVHIWSLHSTGSSNPVGLPFDSDKIHFYPYFMIKDVIGMLLFGLIFYIVAVLYSDLFMDPDNFIFANPLSTPPHIQPEWYFLFAYAILRSVPNKLGGVMALVFSIAVLALLPLTKSAKSGTFRHKPYKKWIIWTHFTTFLILTWIGAMPVEYPFVVIGQVASVLYFLNYVFLMI